MTFNAKLALVGIIGIVVIFLVSIAGCGEVTVEAPGADGGAGKVEAQADGGASGEMAKLDGGPAGTTVTFGTAGTGGAAGEGAAGSSVDGASGRPLGAGCTADTDCTSSICAKASATATAGMCCNGRPDTCSTCIGGYRTVVQDNTSVDACRVCRGGQITALADGTGAGACNTCKGGEVTPNTDGTSCGDPECTGDSVPLPGGLPYYRSSAVHVCMAGACMAVVRDCRTALTCASGTMQNCGSNGFCDVGDCKCDTGNNTATTCAYPTP